VVRWRGEDGRIRLAGMAEPALIVVDVQQAFADPAWGPRDNPDAEANIGRLIEHWRDEGRPVVFVRHDSDEPVSPLRPEEPGNAFQEVVTGEPDLLVTKSVNSAFHGSPDLQTWLDEQRIDQIYVCGITTDHCCETTARVGANLGYDVQFVLDAMHTFDRTTPDGEVIPAELVAKVASASLHDEFATVVKTADVIGQAQRAST
jgi:nicotinamidase-related amidase